MLIQLMEWKRLDDCVAYWDESPQKESMTFLKLILMRITHGLQPYLLTSFT